MKICRVDAFWALYIAIGFFALDGFFAFDRLSAIGINVQGDRSLVDHLKQLVFLSQHLVAIAAIFACLKIRRVIAVPILVLLLLLTIIDLSIYRIVGIPASLTQISVLNGAARLTPDAISEFSDAVLAAALLSIAFFSPLFIRIIRQSESGHVLLFASPLAILFAMLMIKGETSLIGFPRGFSYGFGTLSLKVNQFINSFSEHAEFEIESLSRGKTPKIIVVIDESVAYDQFKPLLSFNEFFLDYGRAFSGSNCSGTSNLIIRKGGWIRGTHVKKLVIRRIENLFALAKKAGYSTVYVDNQDILDNPTENYLTNQEISSIDTIVRTKETYFKRDMSSLANIAKFISGQQVFMIVNKAGTHFPYESNLAPDIRTDIKLQNYRLSLEQNSRNFLDRLSEIIDSETIVFYTSDHGQNFDGRKPHCGRKGMITEAEYAVPFLVITKNHLLRKALQSDREHYYNKLSHLEISESVRNAMAYSVDGIDSIFKPTRQHIGKRLCGHFGDPNPIFGVNPGCYLLK